MPWSTREVAELAGTTINTVRHYHSVGLLTEPERSSNGYKRYEVAHLVRLLQIRRLRDLGVPLTQIEEVGFGGDSPADALKAIDADLAASIARLQRVARRDRRDSERIVGDEHAGRLRGSLFGALGIGPVDDAGLGAAL